MSSRRPSFIYILADDLGYADLGCLGARHAQGRPANITANLDRLAKQGLLFMRGYANSAVCAAPRRSRLQQ
jgi:arylsulfatase A-like enzyme